MVDIRARIMKGVLFCLLPLVGLTAFLLLWDDNLETDMAAVNRVVQSAAGQWESGHFSKDSSIPYDYTVLDPGGNVLYQSAPGLPGSVSGAVRGHDTVLEVKKDGVSLGTVLISTNYGRQIRSLKLCLLLLSLAVFAAFLTCAFLLVRYLDRSLLEPFRRMKDFARHIAAGNLDAPLPMDNGHVFGSFTESFDLMREQLALAREREAEANRSKKELAASLSHDIKTPVTSIKLISELLLVTEQEEPLCGKLKTIYQKADQIDQLVTGLLRSTLEDLKEMTVNLSEESSSILETLIRDVDYYGRVSMEPIPACLLLTDPLRLGQVVDNIIVNAYKYAGTSLRVISEITGGFLRLEFQDFGPGVPDDELPRLFQKFYRGSSRHVREKNGTGLGLYIAHDLMQKMGGSIQYYNRSDGFSVELTIRLA